METFRGTALNISELMLLLCTYLSRKTHKPRSGLWEGPETPQAWLTAMARKKASLSRWEGAVARGDLLDNPVDLSNLFNPNTFLNAVRQQVSVPLRNALVFRYPCRNGPNNGQTENRLGFKRKPRGSISDYHTHSLAVGSTAVRLCTLRRLLRLRTTGSKQINAARRVCLRTVPFPMLFSPVDAPQTARLSGCSMDALKLVSSWDKSRLKSAALPVTVEGLRYGKKRRKYEYVTFHRPNIPFTSTHDVALPTGLTFRHLVMHQCFQWTAYTGN